MGNGDVSVNQNCPESNSITIAIFEILPNPSQNEPIICIVLYGIHRPYSYRIYSGQFWKIPKTFPKGRISWTFFSSEQSLQFGVKSRIQLIIYGCHKELFNFNFEKSYVVLYVPYILCNRHFKNCWRKYKSKTKLWFRPIWILKLYF